MSERDDIREIHLSALLDGELVEGRRAEMEAFLKSDAAQAARYEAMRSDKEMLRRVFEPMAQRPVPQEWLAQAYSRPRQTSWRLFGSMAAALLVGMISIATYLELRPQAPAGVVEEALDVRQDATCSGQMISVDAGTDVARYDGTLQRAVGSRVRVPDMRKAGYRLVSVCVLPHRGGHSTQLAYRDAQNHVFTLYVSHSDGTVEFVQLERRGLRVCLWRDDQISTVMAGDVSTAMMQKLAVLAYAGMTA
jgi:anti-sigma factor RsiW